MKYQLDLTALSCPIPLLTAKKALANLVPNDELVLQLNRQSAVENFVVFCEENQCGCYNVNPACPPESGTVETMKLIALTYEKSLILLSILSCHCDYIMA